MLHSRLQRWAYFLSGYTYIIEVIKSKSNGNCDALSRLPIQDNMPVFKIEYNCCNYIKEGVTTIDFHAVAHYTAKDTVLKKVVNYLQFGWPKTDK